MIPHNKPIYELEESALRVLRSGMLSQLIEVKEFENEFCQFVGLPKGHAVAVSNWKYIGIDRFSTQHSDYQIGKKEFPKSGHVFASWIFVVKYKSFYYI